MFGTYLECETDADLPHRDVSEVLAEADAAECRRLLTACDEQGLDPEQAVLVDTTAYLKHQEEYAEAAEVASKLLRRRGYAPTDVAEMDLAEMAQALTAEVDSE